MKVLYLLHTHCETGEIYELFLDKNAAFQGLAEWVKEYWGSVVQDEELPDPFEKEDMDYYMSESGEWANIVKLDTNKLTAVTLSPSKVWKK
jgi:hypothetical protein